MPGRGVGGRQATGREAGLGPPYARDVHVAASFCFYETETERKRERQRLRIKRTLYSGGACSIS